MNNQAGFVNSDKFPKKERKIHGAITRECPRGT